MKRRYLAVLMGIMVATTSVDSFWGDFRVYYILFFCIFLVSFLLEFCQKSFLLCVFFEWSIFRLNLVVAAYSFGGVHSFLPG